jgi:adenosylcobinamide-phosphate synthase
LTTAFQQAGNYRSIYAGWPVAAMAGGLGVTLGGPLRYENGFIMENKWIGSKESSARLSVADLKRAALLYFVFFLCVVVFISAFLAYF